MQYKPLIRAASINKFAIQNCPNRGSPIAFIGESPSWLTAQRFDRCISLVRIQPPQPAFSFTSE